MSRVLHTAIYTLMKLYAAITKIIQPKKYIAQKIYALYIQLLFLCILKSDVLSTKKFFVEIFSNVLSFRKFTELLPFIFRKGFYF